MYSYDSCLEVMIHLGDQIYADSIKHKAKELVLPHSAALSELYAATEEGNNTPSYNQILSELVADFRAIYRSTWDSAHLKTVLRQGSHYMLPDDHDGNILLSSSTHTLYSYVLSPICTTHIIIRVSQLALLLKQFIVLS